MSFFAALARFFASLNRSDYEQRQAVAALPSRYTVDNNGWVLDNGAPLRRETTTKRGGSMKGPRFIVLHYTANNSTEGTVRVFKTHPVSAHFVLGRDGELIQMVSTLRVAWHAGKSWFKSKWGTPHSGLNAYAIGIELVNYGYKGKHVRSGTNTGSWIEAKHENGGPTRKWQPYTEAQMQVVEELVAALMKKYDIPPEHVVGHDEISPTRKVDPGPAFDLEQLRSRLGGRV